MLKSKDGRVFYREWICDSPKAVIILVHGLGGYSGRFFEFGPHLAKNGIRTYAIELKGFGEAPSIKGHISSFKLYCDELRMLVKLAKAENPGKKVFMFGESLGGLITLDFSIHHQDMLSGIVLISPAIKDKLPISLEKRAKIFAASIAAPLKYFSAEFDANMFTRDDVMARRINSDPLEVRNLTATFFISALKTLIFVNMNPGKISLPVLMLTSGQDTMVSAEAAEAYFAKLPSKDKQLKRYPEMYHALYVDKDREKVFKDIVEWINKHC